MWRVRESRSELYEQTMSKFIVLSIGEGAWLPPVCALDGFDIALASWFTL